jgi:hypothetical protein
VGAIRGMGFEGWIAQEFVPVREWMGSLREALRSCN